MQNVTRIRFTAVLLAAVLSFGMLTSFADTKVSDTPVISDTPTIPETSPAQEDSGQSSSGGTASGSSAAGTGTPSSAVIGDDPMIPAAGETSSAEAESNAGTREAGTGTGNKEEETKADGTQASVSDSPQVGGTPTGGEVTGSPGISDPAQDPSAGSAPENSQPAGGSGTGNSGVSITGPSSGKGSQAPGSRHANDAVTRINLDFSLITPTHSRGAMNVARAKVQQTDGSWQQFDYKANIHYAFYRLKDTKNDASGGKWYVASVKAKRFGDTYSDDGELKSELWLNASDCIIRSTLDINTTSAKRISIVKSALSFLGKQYVYGGNGPDSFDCSGLAKAIYKQAGITVPRTSTQMLQLEGEISAADLRPGDLMVRSGHCGVYIGNGIFIHASDSSVGVVAEYLSVYNLTNKFTNYFNVVGD